MSKKNRTNRSHVDVVTEETAPGFTDTPQGDIQSSTDSGPSVGNTADTIERNPVTTLILSTKTQKGVSAYIYEVPGRRGLVYVPKSFFAQAPDTLVLPITLDPHETKVPAAKLTPEERAARLEAARAARKAMTPLQKAEAAAERAAKMAQRAAKLAAAVK